MTDKEQSQKAKEFAAFWKDKSRIAKTCTSVAKIIDKIIGGTNE